MQWYSIPINTIQEPWAVHGKPDADAWSRHLASRRPEGDERCRQVKKHIFHFWIVFMIRPQVCNQRRIPSHWLCLLLRKREGDGRGGKRNVLSFLKIPRTLTAVNLHLWQPGVHWDGWRKQVHRQVKVLGNASQNAIDQIVLALNDDFCPENVVIFLIVLIVCSLPSIF